MLKSVGSQRVKHDLSSEQLSEHTLTLFPALIGKKITYCSMLLPLAYEIILLFFSLACGFQVDNNSIFPTSNAYTE